MTKLALISTHPAITYSFRATAGACGWALCTVNDITGDSNDIVAIGGVPLVQPGQNIDSPSEPMFRFPAGTAPVKVLIEGHQQGGPDINPDCIDAPGPGAPKQRRGR